MKKALFLILPLAVTLLIFNGCNVATTNSSSESATNKVVAITTTTSETESKTSSVSTEKESAVETTLSVPETQSKTETTVEPVNEKKLNLDLLSDIGLTYEEIKAKRGERTDVYVWKGNMFYSFKDGYGGYAWGLNELDYGQELLSGESFLLPRNENGDLIISDTPSPKLDSKCFLIQYAQVKDLFLGLDQSVNTSELEQLYLVKHKEDGWDAHDSTYFSFFMYEDKYICVQAESEGIVTPDSYLWIKPFSDVF
ncbi:MAG: hypothetical protein GX339_06620 [Tissierellia bacterium]|nr:hypothetical protein [Tissierellia bacterium]